MIDVRVRTPSLARLKRLFEDASEVNARIAGALMTEVRKQFRTRGRHLAGRAWPEYSRLTIYAKSLRGPRGRMLEGLMRKIKTRSGKSFAAVYSDSDVVAFHHEGTEDGGRYPIASRRGGLIAYPHPQGKPIRGREGLWKVTKYASHPGVKQRIIFPSSAQAAIVAREVVDEAIKRAIA